MQEEEEEEDCLHWSCSLQTFWQLQNMLGDPLQCFVVQVVEQISNLYTKEIIIFQLKYTAAAYRRLVELFPWSDWE